ncbi:MAG: carbohydrate kinase [Clostridiales bacterium]|nr:carbohydrate kinase [Clostridiales bacterium]
MKILCFGELLCDMTGISPLTYKVNAGGAPANVAVAAKKAGAEAGVFCKVGADNFGVFLREELEKAGVDTSRLLVSMKHNTTLAFVSLSENGERDFSFYRLADKEITEEEITFDSMPVRGVFHFGSLSLTVEPILKSTLKAIALAKKKNCLVSFDGNYRANLWQSPEKARAKMVSVIPACDIVKLSDEEALLITGIADPFEAAYGVLALGARVAVITMGSAGSIMVTKDIAVAENGYPANCVDSTGAGDCFFGSLLALFALRGGIENITEDEGSAMLRYANAAGAIAVEGYGAIPSYPEKQAVLDRMKG